MHLVKPVRGSRRARSPLHRRDKHDSWVDAPRSQGDGRSRRQTPNHRADFGTAPQGRVVPRTSREERKKSGKKAFPNGVARAPERGVGASHWEEAVVRLVVLGGGFGGGAPARHLERHLAAAAEITLISRENFFVMTPLLFEACTGRLELRHCAQPIRAALNRSRFIEATIQHVDVEGRTV